ncbi:hypothetical protein KO507_13855 [Gilvimarinus agarilyticus]|uniref:hypothetical protein n=1 Tax=unclassified Gilvimarinus TaxID=2642066 RepID=UPI001C092281|nr:MULTISPECIES: hypothetical protein [unclassified Gilvimarinus]MBU2886848.1 hypothetical protein [Gilvimarinus agarilyticus]MDO6571509.1 hypothetical protein [Gilvimarinus sp. 2_MG-2023]MDO6747967.1 hypothetical protein [Gilvimarinus sp. 1_MG-2023]
MDALAVQLRHYEPKLQKYLTQRFGSVPLARKVTTETLNSMQNSEVLPCIGNPYEYITGYAVSLAIRYAKHNNPN